MQKLIGVEPFESSIEFFGVIIAFGQLLPINTLDRRRRDRFVFSLSFPCVEHRFIHPTRFEPLDETLPKGRLAVFIDVQRQTHVEILFAAGNRCLSCFV
jgi:hypothetical protein